MMQAILIRGLVLVLVLISWLAAPAAIATPHLSPTPSPVLGSSPVSSMSVPSKIPYPVHLAMAKSIFSFSGQRPTNLGVTDGKLAACPASPNCVSSQAPASDSQHQIDPIAYQISPSEVMTKLKAAIESLERTEIIQATEDYLYAEFTSALMGYVDDVEFYVTPGAIQVRSASRLGQSDLGVNRKRIEAIRAKLTELGI